VDEVGEQEGEDDDDDEDAKRQCEDCYQEADGVDCREELLFADLLWVTGDCERLGCCERYRSVSA
jgi:hypothetical protein